MRANTDHGPASTPRPDAPALKVVPRPPATPAGAAASARPAARPASRRGPAPDAVATVAIVAGALAVTAWGWSYYVAPLGARLRHPLHALLKPSGAVGLSLGIAAFAFFLFLWLYPLRKKARWLAWAGAVGNWMRVHIVMGLTVPVLAAVHAGWRFEGLIGLGYLSMFVVALSGLVGRYLYVHIPRSRDGLELSMEEVAGERRALVTNIAAATGMVPAEVERRLAGDASGYEGLDPLRTIARMIADDLRRARTMRELRAELSRPRAGRPPLAGGDLAEAMRLARRELALAQQVRMLEATRRVFGYWHVAHRPFAITALLAVVVHVVVALVIGGVGFGGGR